MKYEIVDATIDHVTLLATNMRFEDRREVEADGEGAMQALVRSYRSATICRAAVTEDGQVICIWGLSPYSLMSGTGCIWLLGSDLVKKIPVSFVKDSIRQVSEMLKICPELSNWVDSRYTQACNWLERLGFKQENEKDLNGIPFRHYVKRAA